MREEPPWCVFYADDIILVTESREALQRNLERWRSLLESRGMKISRKKKEYMTTDLEGDQEATIHLGGIRLNRVKSLDL